MTYLAERGPGDPQKKQGTRESRAPTRETDLQQVRSVIQPGAESAPLPSQCDEGAIDNPNARFHGFFSRRAGGRNKKGGCLAWGGAAAFS